MFKKKGLRMSRNNKESSAGFIPYIPSSKSLPEITLLAVLLGIVLAVVFGAANAYLGLKWV